LTISFFIYENLGSS